MIRLPDYKQRAELSPHVPGDGFSHGVTAKSTPVRQTANSV